MSPTTPPPTVLPRKKLPIGIQTFREIREDNCYYVDKSGMAVDLVQTGKAYFLSRPRRFGKSLFLDTLRELFEGNRALFTGLAAEPVWDWSKKFPVIRISFGAGVVASREGLNHVLHQQLSHYETRWALPAAFPDLRSRFLDLIERIAAQTGQRVVVLVDEYDKPILDNIDNSAVALEVREGLKDFYSVIKDSDAYIKFAFLTGVSKFSKVSLFSGLNNLKDITLDARYSALCGYTDADVDTVFAPELPGLDRQMIRDLYNGYNWVGTPVYNPFGLLLLFDTRQFKAHWFETATPTFLIKLLKQRQVFTPDLSRIVASESLLSTFEVDSIPVEALMFQAGYLTIAESWSMPGRVEFTLKYPNLEVQSALNDSLLQSLTNIDRPQVGKLYRLLQAQDFAGMQTLLHALYAGIANDWYRKNELTSYEGYYASVFYCYLAALGMEIHLEDSTNFGRIDMTVLFAGQVFLFEFKVVEMNPAGTALQQLKDMAYADKYRSRGEPIHLIGIEFSKASRNIVGFEVETLACRP